MSGKSDLLLELYSVKNYSLANKEFITNNGQQYISKTKLCNELENDNSYHFRIHKNEHYIFFGDIDGYEKGIKKFIDILIDFMKKHYMT